jgi:peptidoglycan-associated lipoprotein
MKRSWLKLVVLVLMCGLAATGCKKKKPATGADAGDLPPLNNTELGPTGNGPGSIPETTSGPGTKMKGADGREFVVHFAYDSAVVTQDQEILQQVAEAMKSNSGLNVTVTGHCDERGSTEYNLSLGERRALAVRAYLINLGIDGTRLSTQSFGEEQPAQPGHDESSWRENRRAEFIQR